MLFSFACQQSICMCGWLLKHYALLISFGDFIIETLTRTNTNELCKPPCIARNCLFYCFTVDDKTNTSAFIHLPLQRASWTEADCCFPLQLQSIQCVFIATFACSKIVFLEFFCLFLEFCFALISFEVCCCNFYLASPLQYIMLFSLRYRKVSASPQRKSLFLMPLSTFRLLKEKLFRIQQELLLKKL